MKLLQQQAKSNPVHNSVTTQQSTHLSVDFAHLSHRFHIQTPRGRPWSLLPHTGYPWGRPWTPQGKAIIDNPREDQSHCFHIQALRKTMTILRSQNMRTKYLVRSCLNHFVGLTWPVGLQGSA